MPHQKQRSGFIAGFPGFKSFAGHIFNGVTRLLAGGAGRFKRQTVSIIFQKVQHLDFWVFDAGGGLLRQVFHNIFLQKLRPLNDGRLLARCRRYRERIAAGERDG